MWPLLYSTWSCWIYSLNDGATKYMFKLNSRNIKSEQLIFSKLKIHTPTISVSLFRCTCFGCNVTKYKLTGRCLSRILQKSLGIYFSIFETREQLLSLTTLQCLLLPLFLYATYFIYFGISRLLLYLIHSRLLF